MILRVRHRALERRNKNRSKKLCGVFAGDIARIEVDRFLNKLALILAVIQRIKILWCISSHKFLERLCSSNSSELSHAISHNFLEKLREMV